MTLHRSLVVLLLLGLTVTTQATTPLCVFSEDMTRCVCNIMVIQDPKSLICFQALELELRDGKLDASGTEISLDINFIVQLFQINKLIFNNVTIPFSLIRAVIPFLSLSKLNEINMISSTVEVVRPLQLPQLPDTSKIETLKLEDVTVDPSLLHPSFQAFHHWLFSSLKFLSVVRSGLAEIDCSWAQRAENLTHLDLSENPISLMSLQNISRCYSLSFEYLKSLHLRNSNLSSLQSLCVLLNLTTALVELDVSGNNFSNLRYPRCLQVQLLRMLNLSHSGITEVDSLLFTSLEELDLSYNSLEVFNNPPQTLKKLNLSNNHLLHLPSLSNMSHLQELHVDSNQLTILVNETGDSLSTLEQLDVLRAGRNPYHCDCALNETVVFLNNTDSVSEGPEEFLCAAPEALKGTQIMNLSFEACVKPTSGTQHQSYPLCLTLYVGVVSQLISF